MMSVIRMIALCLSVSLASCTEGFAPPPEIVAPAEGRVNVPMDLAVTGTFAAGDTLQWTATGGRFNGPTNTPTATLVPTAPGSLSIVLTIRNRDGSTTIPRATIHVPVVSTAAGTGRTTELERSAAAQRVPPAAMDVDREGFVPSGLMGDGEAGYVTINPNDRTQPRSAPTAYRVSYKPGPVGWAAIAWQYPESNWGDWPGRNLQRGFRQVSIFARADPDPRTGAFPVVQFKAGGVTDPTRKHQASFEVIGQFVTLSNEWKEYVLPLEGHDLSNVAAALTVVIRAQDIAPSGVTFFLDDIEYQ